MLDFVFLIGGIGVIILSANWLVDGASAIAKKYNIPDIVIGLTIVSFGTSAPELVVNVFSALEGATDIAIGNVVGSNISNILLIVGVSSIVFPLSIQSSTKWKEIPFSLLAAIALGLLANDSFFNGGGENKINCADGIVLLLFLTIYMVYAFQMARTSKVEEAVDSIKIIAMKKSIFLILVGLAGLYFGGKYLVEGAVNIALNLHMDEKVIGITIIAIGTSLPELATSIVAATKKKTDIAVGNVIGSNIFNIFFILGITSTIKPLHFNPSINVDILMVLVASALLFISTITFGKSKVDRSEGIVFVLIYIAYITYSILNQ